MSHCYFPFKEAHQRSGIQMCRAILGATGYLLKVDLCPFVENVIRMSILTTKENLFSTSYLFLSFFCPKMLLATLFTPTFITRPSSKWFYFIPQISMPFTVLNGLAFDRTHFRVYSFSTKEVLSHGSKAGLSIKLPKVILVSKIEFILLESYITFSAWGLLFSLRGAFSSPTSGINHLLFLSMCGSWHESLQTLKSAFFFFFSRLDFF